MFVRQTAKWLLLMKRAAEQNVLHQCICREKEEEIVMSIRIGILGYGNLGRGVECAIKHNPDTNLVAVFTRRDPETVKTISQRSAKFIL